MTFRMEGFRQSRTTAAAAARWTRRTRAGRAEEPGVRHACWKDWSLSRDVLMVEGVFLSGGVTGRCLWDWWPLVCPLGTLWLARSHRRASKWAITGGCVRLWVCVWNWEREEHGRKKPIKKQTTSIKEKINWAFRGCRNRTGRWWRKEEKHVATAVWKLTAQSEFSANVAVAIHKGGF